LNNTYTAAPSTGLNVGSTVGAAYGNAGNIDDAGETGYAENNNNTDSADDAI
jgi:hypothetical protein